MHRFGHDQIQTFCLICNFRSDRIRQISCALVDPEFNNFKRKKNLVFSSKIGMTNYSENLDKYLETLFPSEKIRNTLGQIVSDNGMRQLRIAETEKYPHVTFFFSGGREKHFIGEERIIVESPKVATYNLQPEMSAYEITSKITEVFETKKIDFVCLNFANPDMVGHTGDYKAIIKAVETVDNCLKVVDEKFNSDLIVNKYLEIYKSFLNPAK